MRVKSLFTILLVSLLVSASAEGSEILEQGRLIYQQQCVRCHGEKGEGVDDIYDEALHGDRSVAKLARVIAKTMPEDKDEKCTGPDAEAVAKYIHETFYSPEARSRNNQARVELVHLTNRQFQNSLADLFKTFTGNDKPIGSERGIKGSYFDSKGFQRDKKIEDRLDPEVNVDFQEGMPEGVTTNEFAIQWRGSLLAEESGTYEFAIRSPNGVRVWINDEGEEPTIDGWVSSAMLIEHRVSMKLIGGRAYVLRVHWHKAKDKTASVQLLWKRPLGALEIIPTRNLSPSRVEPTFVLQTSFPADDSSAGYERGTAVSKEWAEATTMAALEAAAFVIKNLNGLSKTSAKDTNRVEKLKDFSVRLVEAAFRRPLNDEDQARVAAYFDKAKPEEALKRSVLFAIKSPRFLYHGIDAITPDDFEIASRLSFALWDSIPDKELTKAAAAGKLRFENDVNEQLKRMIADPRTKSKTSYFFQNWLHLKSVEEVSKDPDAYPGFTPEIISDLRASLDRFVQEVVWNESSDYRNLLQADYVYVNKRLAKFYELEGDFSDEFVPFKWNSDHRSGVITHPFLLTTFAYPKTTSPIHRGVFLTRNIVGRALKPPTVAVAFNNADFDPNLSMREKVTQLTKSESCQTCHSLINPLGFVLEHFDAVGRWRELENGKAIEAASEYVLDDESVKVIKNPKEVAEFAVNSEHAQEAFIERMFHHLVKQPIHAYSANTMERLRQSFAASGFNIQKLMIDIVSATALHNTQQTAQK
ncbi:MAG: DUF1592 domain-containing protein [Verrucomicrobiales bacterium]